MKIQKLNFFRQNNWWEMKIQKLNFSDKITDGKWKKNWNRNTFFCSYVQTKYFISFLLKYAWLKGAASMNKTLIYY